MRLERFISKHTEHSHKTARLLVASGRVCVEGEVCRNLKQEIHQFHTVSLDDQVLQHRQAHYLMLHKPSGYLSATSDPVHPTVMELIAPELRPHLHIGGRLDRASSGLLILTNDGLWSRQLTDPQRKSPKVYRVTTAYPICPDTPDRFARGIDLKPENLTTSPADLELLAPNEVRLTIYEGRYHQIKRMFAAVGNRVIRLHREQMGAINLDPTLAPGGSRSLTQHEIASISPRL
ncbi:pseudouridine synthase [Marinobacter mobilis]|uniref:Pseudouridine synthase n=1 Tax=Marinobacter mobilis TaxID=488533 RepID=A0A1H2STB9_9GAMM|nr:pseudouridine synthase [Marinobacter mobilis]SDW34705.1 16S rRNA pseudouridine516 synthase [Marinobacter mobilis]